MKQMILFGLVFAISTVALASSADALSCRQRLVDVGDASARVLDLCGEPAELVQRTEQRSVVVSQQAPDGSIVSYTLTQSVVVESWLYDFGPQRFMQRLIFEDGVLRRIEALSYGTASGAPR